MSLFSYWGYVICEWNLIVFQLSILRSSPDFSLARPNSSCRPLTSQTSTCTPSPFRLFSPPSNASTHCASFSFPETAWTILRHLSSPRHSKLSQTWRGLTSRAVSCHRKGWGWWQTSWMGQIGQRLLMGWERWLVEINPFRYRETIPQFN